MNATSHFRLLGLACLLLNYGSCTTRGRTAGGGARDSPFIAATDDKNRKDHVANGIKITPKFIDLRIIDAQREAISSQELQNDPSLAAKWLVTTELINKTNAIKLFL